MGEPGLREYLEARLGAIRTLSAIEASGEKAASAEQLQIEKDRQEVRAQQIENDAAEEDKSARSSFGKFCRRLTIGWLTFASVTVIFGGFHPLGFDLPSSVLITLLGSTTATVIGLLAIVMRYLFPRRDGH